MAMVELSADVPSVIMEAVTPAGWVGRLVCRSFAVASTVQVLLFTWALSQYQSSEALGPDGVVCLGSLGDERVKV
jgi:hypothetical protein